jgi:helix-turn-helix protein
MRDHAYGCACKRHVDRPWRRPEHWTRAEVEFLESWRGRRPDAWIAEQLGRSELGVFLKARRLGIGKRDAGFTAREVAEIFGIDPGTVVKVWIRRGLLPAYPGGRKGRSPRGARAARRSSLGRVAHWVIQSVDVERFIRHHGQYVDVDKMPASPYRDLAEQHRFYSVPDVVRLTGRSQSSLNVSLARGLYRAVKRGPHWYVPADELPRIAQRAHLGPASPTHIRERRRLREQTLELRRNRRKGVAA